MRVLTAACVIGCIATLIVAFALQDSAAANLFILLGLGSATLAVYTLNLKQ